MNRSFSKTKIYEFLYFGYLPSVVKNHNQIFLLSRILKNNNNNTYYENNRYKVIDKGISLFKNIIKDELGKVSQIKNHVIPLSGGMDSRAILCGLLEHVDTKQIQTVTFGTPSTLDYEIGNRVAKQAGVKHETIDLTSPNWKWDYDEIIETVNKNRIPVTIFDAYVNHKIPELFGNNYIYWSGFMGDPITGSRLPENISKTWDDAKNYFIKKNKIIKSINITQPCYDPMTALPEKPFHNPELLCYDDQLDFIVRQYGFIKHIVINEEYKYCTPFINPEWTNFLLNLPSKFREKQWLYKEILQSTYPKLFSLPVKNNYGYSLKLPSSLTWPKRGFLKAKKVIESITPGINLGVDPGINYIDFDKGIRERLDLKDFVYENIKDLKRRNLITWLDIEDIWKRHQRKLANHADALLILTALEIYLKIEENIAQ